MRRVASTPRGHWAIAILGSVAFHAAILFLPVGAPGPKERTASIFQVALDLSGPVADTAEPRVAAPNRVRKVAETGAPADAAATSRRAVDAQASAVAPEGVPTLTEELRPIPSGALTPTGEPGFSARGAPFSEPANAQEAPAASAPIGFSQPIAESPAELVRIAARAPSASNNAEASPPIVGTPAQISIPSPPSPASSIPVPTEPKPLPLVPPVAPVKQNYFKSAQKLLSPTKETFVIAVSAPNSVLRDSAAISHADAAPQAISTPPSENPQRDAAVSIEPAPQAYNRTLPPEPAHASAMASERIPEASRAGASTEAVSPNRPKEVAASAPVQNYFPNREIFVVKSTADRRAAMPTAASATSIGAGAPESTAMNEGGDAGGEGRGDTSLSAADLRGETRAARALNPLPALNAPGLASESPATAQSNGAPDTQEFADKIADIRLAEGGTPQALPELLEPLQPEPSSGTARVASGESTVPAPASKSSEDSLAQASSSQPTLDATEASGGTQVPASAPDFANTSAPASAPAIASTRTPASAQKTAKAPTLVPAPVTATAPASVATPHYDSVETLASRILAELTARKHYPAAALRRKTEGVVMLILSVEKDGNLVSATFQARSGSAILDEAALSLARGIFPVEIHLAAPVSLVIPIEYRIPK